MTTKRRPHDRYFTPSEALSVLLAQMPDIQGMVYEPCSGQGALTNALRHTSGISQVMYNDLLDTSTGHDASQWWPEQMADPNWVISNPPFSQAFPIIQHTWQYVDNMAWLLRLSWLEPTQERGLWLAQNPPTQLIVLPRISFTGDGKMDSVTCAWMVWRRSRRVHGAPIQSVSKDTVETCHMWWGQQLRTFPCPLVPAV